MAPYLLVVESDPELQRRIGDALKEAKYELSSETEGAWARRSLAVRPPDAVILDTSLTDGSGFSVADAIRKDDDTAKVPIFFVASKYRGASHRTEARRRFSPAYFFPTPLDMDSLLAALLEAVPPRDAGSTVAIPDYPPPVRLTDAAQRQERKEVERTARELSAFEAELSGSLATEPFARTLQQIYGQRMTGSLLLTNEPVKKLVFFREGYPIWVRSNALHECLGQILLSNKLITQGVLDESLRRMEAQKKQQGSVLVEMGALSPYNLSRALVKQMEAKLYDVFSWERGKFVLTEGKEPRSEPVRLDKTPAELILEGIRRYYGPERQAAVLEPYTRQFVAPSDDPFRRLQNITRDPAELAFIDGLDGSARLEEVLALATIPPDRARLLLVSMSEAGMIEPSRTPTRKRADEPARSKSLAATERPADQKTREELTALLETMRAQSHFAVLGVGPSADGATVDRAYENVARDYHPDHFRFLPDDLRAIALKIFDRLGEARATLRDGNRRRKYVTQIDRERSGRGDHTEPLALQDASSAAAEQVYYAGVEHMRSRRYRFAVEAFRQATMLAPSQASYHGALGWALFRESPADPVAIAAGQAELKHATEIDKRNPWVRISLGRFFAETGQADEAIAQFEVALRLNPGLTDIEEEIRRLRGQT
jgi:DNA-binding response OmpR family regulator/tetratricopeptide (TPR) repeat protein